MAPYFVHFPMSECRLPYITPLMGGRQQCGSGYTYGPVMRKYYIIEYVIRGKGEYLVGGESYSVGAGQAFVIKPFERHLLKADSDDPWEYVWIGFATELALPKIIENGYVFDATAVSDIFMRLADGNEKGRTLADYATEIYGIFARLYDAEVMLSDKKRDMVEQAIDIIRNEYATVTVQSLADRFFVNRSYFGARFKEKTGKSPKVFIDETRLATSAMMMSELGYTATQAALAVGYSDVMSFSRMYKKHFGKPPRSSMQKHSESGATIILK